MKNDDFVGDIEPVSAILRVFSRGAVPGVDEYEFSCTVIYRDDGKTAELKGITSRGLNILHYRHAVFKSLYLQGVNTVIWDRRKDDKTRKITVDLHSYFRRHHNQV